MCGEGVHTSETNSCPCPGSDELFKHRLAYPSVLNPHNIVMVGEDTNLLHHVHTNTFISYESNKISVGYFMFHVSTL